MKRHDEFSNAEANAQGALCLPLAGEPLAVGSDKAIGRAN